MPHPEPASSGKDTRKIFVKCKCPDCDFVPQSHDEWLSHRRVHSGKRPFACNLCDSKFKLKGNRDRHFRQVHHKSDSVTCSWSGCDKTFTCERSMQKHVAAIHQQTMISCPVAGCTFASGWREGVKKHVRAIHAKEKPFTCSASGCHFTSSWSESLRLHMVAAHTKEKPFACSCGYVTSRRAHLKVHVDCVHKKLLRFKCHVCGKSFCLKSSLRRHQQVHAKQGHPVADCSSCLEDRIKKSKRSSHVSQEQQPSTSSFDGVSDLLTSVHLDMHLLSSHNLL